MDVLETRSARVSRDPVVLDDGRTVHLRLLGAADAAALASAIQSEDRVDLHRRFLGTPPPIRMLVAQLCAADDVHDLPIGAYDDGGNLVGVAQFDRRDGRPEAEVALEVAHPWQRAGLGRILLDRLAAEAQARGIQVVNATFFADNTGIRKLLSGMGTVLNASTSFGIASMRIDIRTGSPLAIPVP